MPWVRRTFDRMVKSRTLWSVISKVTSRRAQGLPDSLAVPVFTSILVMNAEEDGFEDCINYELEPAIYSFQQLDQFIKELIFQGQIDYPVHLKLDTGMKRLGFELSDIPRVCEIIKSQPEIKIKSVYSHLADADNRRDKRFT